jgi:hypothetical protein
MSGHYHHTSPTVMGSDSSVGAVGFNGRLAPQEEGNQDCVGEGEGHGGGDTRDYTAVEQAQEAGEAGERNSRGHVMGAQSEEGGGEHEEEERLQVDGESVQRYTRSERLHEEEQEIGGEVVQRDEVVMEVANGAGHDSLALDAAQLSVSTRPVSAPVHNRQTARRRVQAGMQNRQASGGGSGSSRRSKPASASPAVPWQGRYVSRLARPDDGNRRFSLASGRQLIAPQPISGGGGGGSGSSGPSGSNPYRYRAGAVSARASPRTFPSTFLPSSPVPGYTTRNQSAVAVHTLVPTVEGHTTGKQSAHALVVDVGSGQSHRPLDTAQGIASGLSSFPSSGAASPMFSPTYSVGRVDTLHYLENTWVCEEDHIMTFTIA